MLLAASGAPAAEADPAEAAARAAELTRSGRFEEALLAWREAAQRLAAAGQHSEQCLKWLFTPVSGRAVRCL